MRLGPFAILLVASPSVQAFATQSPASAETCGRCHRAIQDTWRVSAHANAMQSRSFQDALEAAETEFGPQTRRTCLGCHAPLAVRIGDLTTLYRKVSWEGVTCDFCHSIQTVSAAGARGGARFQFTSVRSGPLRETDPACRRSASSTVSLSALLCAPCHQYRNSGGFSVLTTYTEWISSPSAHEGKLCNSCHMYEVAGNVADPKIARAPSGQRVNLHLMPGGHSPMHLAAAIKAQLFAERDKSGLRVRVDVSNRGAGHYAPTGSPLRRIILEVRADTSDGKRFQQERAYVRRIADREGREITAEPAAFMRAARVISDSRLAPGETRREDFDFPLPQGVGAHVNAKLWYMYSPLTQGKPQNRFIFLTLNRIVK